MSEKIATREAYGKALVELGASNDKIVVLDADLAGATMTKFFKAAYPDRFFDCGIAECNMMDVAAGLSTMGLIPFCSTFAMFGAGRAYEQIRNSIAYPRFNVKICCSHATATRPERPPSLWLKWRVPPICGPPGWPPLFSSRTIPSRSARPTSSGRVRMLRCSPVA